MLKITPNPPELLEHISECRKKKFALAMLSWRSIKLRYTTTVAGPAWIILQPLIQVVLMTFVFGKLLRINTGCDYLRFATISMTAWTFISATVDRVGNVLALYRDFILKVKVPALIYPTSAVVVTFADFLVVLAIANITLLFHGVSITAPATLALAILGIIVLTFAVGTLVSVASLFLKDLKLITPLLIQILMYGSPVLYPASMIPTGIRPYYDLNPYAVYFEMLRSAYGVPATLGLGQIITAMAITGAMGLLSLWSFNRISHRIPELL